MLKAYGITGLTLLAFDLIYAMLNFMFIHCISDADVVYNDA